MWMYWNEYTMICASRALKHGVSDSRVLTTPVRYRNRLYLDCNPQPSKLKHQKKLVCFIQPRKRSLHIIQWWDVLTLRSVCISQCATLFRNNRACVSKRNTLELIIHWKRNMSIYSLRHLLCNQLGFLYISPVLEWLLKNGFACWITGLKTFPEFSGLKWSDCKQRSEIGKKKV